MSEGSTGIGLLDRLIIDVLQRLRANADGRPVRGDALLRELDDLGLPPQFAYEHIAVSTRAALRWIRPYRPKGNLGSRSDPPANPRYVEISLTELGEFFATSQPTCVPMAFINGNVEVEGPRPAFEPMRVLDAVAETTTNPTITDADLVELVGPPSFPSGCTVEGDLEALHAGEPTSLVLAARLQPDATGTNLLMSGIPPLADPDDVLTSLASRAGPAPSWRPEEVRLPLADIHDRSTRERDEYALKPRAGTSLEVLRSELLQVWGVSTRLDARLPAATATIIRRHAEGDPDLVLATIAKVRSILSST